MQINVTAPYRAKLCALAAALVLSPGVARAADAPKLPRFMRLEYRQPPGKSCPGQPELRDLLVVAANRDLFNDVAPALLRVSIARRSGNYEATIELRDAAGVNVWPDVPAVEVEVGRFK